MAASGPYIWAIVRSTRPSNIIMIAVGQYLYAGSLLYPTLQAYQIPKQFSEFYFSLLVLATCLLALGSFWINDLFDIQNDRISKAHRALPAGVIPAEHLRWGYLLSLILAFSISIYLLPLTGHYLWIMLFFVYAFVGYKYSAIWQSRILIGNLAVSFCVGSIFFIVFLSEWKSSASTTTYNYPNAYQ